MKKKRKIYAVHGMMEYQTIAWVGKNSIKIGFTGGSICNGCTQPARYSTSHLIVQEAIERSEDFRRGRIRLEQTIPLDEELIIERATLNSGSEPEGAQGVMPDNPAAETYGNDAEPEEAEDAPADDVDTKEAAPGALEVVDASCKDVAKQYLEEHYGETPTPLRTRDDVQRCAAKHGITFNFV